MLVNIELKEGVSKFYSLWDKNSPGIYYGSFNICSWVTPKLSRDEEFPILGKVQEFKLSNDTIIKIGSLTSYGVCDDLKNWMKKYKCIIKDKNRKFFVCFTPIYRENQPPEGGWRWHKWGPYIGKKKPKHEYLYDEIDIDLIYVFGVHEVL